MMKSRGLAGLGEFGLIERIQRQAGSAPFLRLGIGDDCAAQLVAADEELLTSTDLLLEGVHFNRQWTDLEQLGRKCVAVNVSDIAAMGGVPRCLLLGVALPSELSIDQLEGFIRGFLQETDSYGAVLAGGDTCRSPGPLMISVTVQGVVEKGRAIQRRGAGPGELIMVSGTLGDSALALQQMQRGEQPEPWLAERHHRPRARVELGRRLAERGLATAMLDVSDGLLADLGHILDAAQLGAELTLEALPLSQPFAQACRERSELIELALAGGEDYELLFTAKPEAAEDLAALAGELDLPLTRIGRLSETAGITVRRGNGEPYRCQRGGFDHFA